MNKTRINYHNIVIKNHGKIIESHVWENKCEEKKRKEMKSKQSHVQPLTLTSENKCVRKYETFELSD